MYTIKTIGRNKNRAIGVSWEVKRKYSDFEWLKNTLHRFYPGIVVPAIPPFPKSKDRLSGQSKKLENFLMDSYRCP